MNTLQVINSPQRLSVSFWLVYQRIVMGAQSATIDPPRKSLAHNKTKKILEDAENGGYGIIASIV
jgi:hypothetical protein